jgi:hypothetical protein
LISLLGPKECTEVGISENIAGYLLAAIQCLSDLAPVKEKSNIKRQGSEESGEKQKKTKSKPLRQTKSSFASILSGEAAKRIFCVRQFLGDILIAAERAFVNLTNHHVDVCRLIDTREKLSLICGIFSLSLEDKFSLDSRLLAAGILLNIFECLPETIALIRAVVIQKRLFVSFFSKLFLDSLPSVTDSLTISVTKTSSHVLSAYIFMVLAISGASNQDTRQDMERELQQMGNPGGVDLSSLYHSIVKRIEEVVANTSADVSLRDEAYSNIVNDITHRLAFA